MVGDGPNACGLPNRPDFVDHRHDQSVLTNLVVKHDVKPFRIDDRVFTWLVALRPHTLAANLFCKQLDKMSAVAAGTNPAMLYVRHLVVQHPLEPEPDRQGSDRPLRPLRRRSPPPISGVPGGVFETAALDGELHVVVSDRHVEGKPK